MIASAASPAMIWRPDLVFIFCRLFQWGFFRREFLWAEGNAGSEGIGNGFELAQLGMSEIGAGFGSGGAFARYLNHSDYFFLDHHGHAHDFLDGFAADQFRRDRHRLEYGSVRHDGKVVDDLGAFFAHGARGQRIGAREWNLAYGAQVFGNDEAKESLVGGKAEDRDLVGLHGKIFTDQVGRAHDVIRLAGRAFASDLLAQLSQFTDVFAWHLSRWIPPGRSVTQGVEGSGE